MNTEASEDKARGVGNEALGKVKEAVGDITGNEKIEAEGAAQQAKGSAQQAVGEVKESAQQAVGEVKEAASHVAEKASAVAHNAAQTASDALSGRDPEAAKGLVALVTSGGFLLGLASGVGLSLLFLRRR